METKFTQGFGDFFPGVKFWQALGYYFDYFLWVLRMFLLNVFQNKIDYFDDPFLELCQCSCLCECIGQLLAFSNVKARRVFFY